ncbi:hypothetical protein WN943_026335 [Citrus x changshan-huyou]
MNYNIGFLLIKGSGPYNIKPKEQSNGQFASVHRLVPKVLSSLPKKEGKEHGVQYEKARLSSSHQHYSGIRAKAHRLRVNHSHPAPAPPTEPEPLPDDPVTRRRRIPAVAAAEPRGATTPGREVAEEVEDCDEPRAMLFVVRVGKEFKENFYYYYAFVDC